MPCGGGRHALGSHCDALTIRAEADATNGHAHDRTGEEASKVACAVVEEGDLTILAARDEAFHLIMAAEVGGQQEDQLHLQHRR